MCTTGTPNFKSFRNKAKIFPTVVEPELFSSSTTQSETITPLNYRTYTTTLLYTCCTQTDQQLTRSNACCDCQAAYNGGTGKNLSTRLTEHKRATRNSDVNNNIAEYHLQTKPTGETDQFDWHSATCITYSTDYYIDGSLYFHFTNLEQTPLNRSQQLPTPPVPTTY